MTFKETEQKLIQKAEQEFEHIADPSECGNIVRGHFDGIIFGVYVFMAVFLAAAMVGIYFYVRHM